jgi:chorismate synthase
MNSFGRLFRVEIFGESHGSEIGVIIDGVPAGIEINQEELAHFLQRRRPSLPGTTPRKEADLADFKSGLKNNFTTGSPILITFANANVNSANYEQCQDIPRPNHSDFVALKKYYGFNEIRGGGHFSGRLTVGLVVAGFIAKQIIKNVEINAEIYKIGNEVNYETILQNAIKNRDSLGAEIRCKVKNLPIGLGEPFFDSVESLLAHAIFSIPGVKALSFGLEKSPLSSLGSQYNDTIIDESGKTKTNNSGGINGGITNGNNLEFSLQVKPTASIGRKQKSFSLKENKIVEFSIPGRHDVCFGLRIPVIVEAVTAFVLADLYLIRRAQEREYESH